MACCSCWLVVLLLVLVVTGQVLPLLLRQGGHVLISSYAKEILVSACVLTVVGMPAKYDEHKPLKQ